MGVGARAEDGGKRWGWGESGGWGEAMGVGARAEEGEMERMRCELSNRQEAVRGNGDFREMGAIREICQIYRSRLYLMYPL